MHDRGGTNRARHPACRMAPLMHDRAARAGRGYLESVSETAPTPAPRASDADRDAAIDVISDAAARGALTLAEHEERVGQALQARTRNELVELRSDLEPVAAAPPPAARRKPSRWVVSVMGGNDKRGRWRLGSQLTVVAVMGGSDVDLRAAELDSREVTITVVSVMGGSSIYVPDTADVDLGGFAVMGGNGQRGSTRAARPGAPVIRVRAYSLMGGSDVWRLPAGQPGLSLRDARHAAKQLES